MSNSDTPSTGMNLLGGSPAPNSELPALVVDPDLLPALVPVEVAFARFLPWLKARLLHPGTAYIKPNPAFEPWDLSLEMEYQKVHPDVWEVLEADDGQDWAAYDSLKADHETAVDCQERKVSMAKLGERIFERTRKILGSSLCYSSIESAVLLLALTADPPSSSRQSVLVHT
ncbi:hypothetical protein JCM11251_002676 [Rhodosporidiobolus azoricus]